VRKIDDGLTPQQRFALRHPERLKEISRAWRERHHDKVLAREREYHALHREERRAYSRGYHALHREENRKTALAYYYAHREERATYSRLYRQAHLEECRARARAYLATHPEKRREHKAEYYARKRGAMICDFTAEQWERLKEIYQNRCAYCGKVCDDLEQDHVLPLSRGGDHTLYNIVPACRSCNGEKHDKTLPEYLEYIWQKRGYIK